MKIAEKDGIHFVSGDIARPAEFEVLKVPAGRIRFDFSAVRAFSSVGVRAWISWIRKSQIKPTYVNASPALVDQLNMISLFLEGGAMIESVLVPCSCPRCGTSKMVVLRSGVDFFPEKPVLFRPPQCERNGCTMEPEHDVEEYLHFVTRLQTVKND